MSFIAAFLGYWVISAIAGAVLARRYIRDNYRHFSKEVVRRLRLFPATGLGYQRAWEDLQKKPKDPLPLEWYTAKSSASFHTWALLGVGLVFFYWQDIVVHFAPTHEMADLYMNMAKGLFLGIAGIFLGLIKLMTMGVAYVLLVVLPNSRALRIERDHWRDHSR